MSGIVFDEVIGNVAAQAPATGDSEQEPSREEPPAPPNPGRLQQELRLLERRAARVHAD